MPEITKTTLTYRRAKAKRSRIRRTVTKFTAITLLIALLIGSFGYYRYATALPLMHAQLQVNSYSPPAPSPLKWPKKGQAAVGTTDFGVLETHGSQKPMPTASTAKLITLLAVLESKPLRKGDQGPILVMGDRDIQSYNRYVAQLGSVVPVNFGEHITQYQAIQAVLLASANNMADSLAIWAFGSLENYSLYANQMIESYGLKNTTVGSDASGLSPTTKSTASDLLIIAQKALKNPIINEIVAQKSATIPVAGRIYNTNWLLGSDGVNGVKTGNSDEAGGVFVLSGTHAIGSGTVTILTVVMGAPDIKTAMETSKALYDSAKPNLTFVEVVHSGDVVGKYVTPWGKTVSAVAVRTINGPIWLDSFDQPEFNFNTIKAPKKIGDTVGEITFKRADGIKLTSEIRLSQDMPAPSIKWRLFRGNSI